MTDIEYFVGGVVVGVGLAYVGLDVLGERDVVAGTYVGYGYQEQSLYE